MFKFKIFISLVVVGLLLSVVSVSAKEISTPPNSPLGIMYLNEKALSDMNMQWVRVRMAWRNIETVEGQYNWPQRLYLLREKGIKFWPTLKLGVFKNTSLPVKDRLMNISTTKSTSYPPKDLTSVWNDTYGFSKSLYRFVNSLVTEFKDSLIALSIENEEDNFTHWPASEDGYIRVLKTAYKAAHDAKQDIIVTNGGFSSKAYLISRADEMFKEDRPADEIIRFIKEYGSNLKWVKRLNLHTKHHINKFVERPVRKKRVARIDFLIRNYNGCIDALNFHHYESIIYLNEIAKYLKNKMLSAGYSVPIVSNEIGIHYIKPHSVNDRVANSMIVKRIVKGFAAGIKLISFFPYTSGKGEQRHGPIGPSLIGILEPHKKIPVEKLKINEKRATAFKIIHSVIRETPIFMKKTKSKGGLAHYIFTNSQITKKTHILWKERGDVLHNVKLEGATSICILNLDGKKKFIEPDKKTDIIIDSIPTILIYEYVNNKKADLSDHDKLSKPHKQFSQITKSVIDAL